MATDAAPNTQADQPPYPFDAKDRSAIRWLLPQMRAWQETERDRAISSAVAMANFARYYEDHGGGMDAKQRIPAVEKYASTASDALDNADKAAERIAVIDRWQRYFTEEAETDGD